MNSERFDIYDDFDIYSIEDKDYTLRDGETDEILEDKRSIQKSIDNALSDVKKILRFVRTGTEPRFIYKSVRDKGGHGVSVIPYDDAKKLFNTVKLQGLPKVKVGGQMKNMTLWKLIEDNEKALRVKRMSFLSDDPEVFNSFSGYRLQPLKTFDESLIKLHLQHWKEILCSGNEEQYNYLIKWCARLLKLPNALNRTGLVLLSKQGTGKNTFFTDHLINIIGDVYAYTESNANNIFGEFNKSIENKHLVVCNEMVDVNTQRRTSDFYDKLKSTMNDQTISIRAMRTDAYSVDNVFNLIVVSNNGMPFRIDDEDRRLVFLDVSNKYAAVKDSVEARDGVQVQERKNYFDALLKEMRHPLFLQTLYSYLLSQYDESWDPEYNKPLTKAKEIILERSVNPLEEFIEMNIKEISKELLTTVSAYTAYKEYCLERGHKFISNIHGFLGDLKQKYDIDKRRKTDSENHKLTVLMLTDEGKQRYAKLLSEDEEEAGAPLWLQLEAFKQFIPDEKMREFFDLREKLRLGF